MLGDLLGNYVFSVTPDLLCTAVVIISSVTQCPFMQPVNVELTEQSLRDLGIGGKGMEDELITTAVI